MMSKLCFSLVTLLAVIAFSEARGFQTYGNPWFMKGILPQSYGPPAWGINPKHNPMYPMSETWLMNKGMLNPRVEPERKPKPEYKPIMFPIAENWLRGKIYPKSEPEYRPRPGIYFPKRKPEYKPKRGIFSPKSKPDYKPKREMPYPEIERRPYPRMFVPKGRPEYKPIPEMPYPEIKRRPYPKMPYPEIERRPYPKMPYPEIERRPYPKMPYPEIERRPYPKMPYPMSEGRPRPVYPPMYPVVPLPIMPRYPYPLSYPTFPFLGQNGFPYRRQPFPFVPQPPPVYYYPRYLYGNFMKQSYYPQRPTTAFDYNKMQKSPQYASWLLKYLLKLKAMGPQNMENQKNLTGSNDMISTSVELKDSNCTVRNDVLIPNKQPLKKVLKSIIESVKCFNYTSKMRKSRVSEKITGEFVESLCNKHEIYGTELTSRFWVLYTPTGKKDIDLNTVLKNNTNLMMEYVNLNRLNQIIN